METTAKQENLTDAEKLERVQRVMNAATLGTFLPIWRRNFEANWPNVFNVPGIKHTWGALPGVPAVVVGCGPSIKRTLPVLAKCWRRFCVIACDRAYDMCLENGIIPALTVSLDAQDVVAEFFKNHRRGDLVALNPIQDPSVFKTIPRGDQLIYSEYPGGNPLWENAVETCFDGDVNYFGATTPGGNVGFTAAETALGLHCNPIVMIGLDLCYQEDEEKIVSSPGFISSLTCFDKLFTEVAEKYRMINATGGGMLQCCEQMSMDEVAATIGGPEINHAWQIRKHIRRSIGK